MNAQTTEQALASITDEGLFERLATAILRKSSALYDSLVHTGINVAGKTVKAPLDGICFVTGSKPRHLIAVHHTITAREGLEKKWLHDPSKVKTRKGLRPTAPPGDLVKTADIVAKERTQEPSLEATLVLTTNEEPSVEVVLSVQAAARACEIEIDLWPRSRLCDFLDNRPDGQWLRHSFLNIGQELLSVELFKELSKTSLAVNQPPGNPNAWVRRALDDTLKNNLRQGATFLVAPSGSGKTVACHRTLLAHVGAGGICAVLPHDVIASSVTLEQAVGSVLRQLHPELSQVGENPLSFGSVENPILLVVEDVNRSGQAEVLIEKIVRWSRGTEGGGNNPGSHWRLICPIWQETLVLLREQVRKLIEPLIAVAGGFSDSEGGEAVLARAKLDGRRLSVLSAQEISRALANDPLLIALHEPNTNPDPREVIGQFISSSLSRMAAEERETPAVFYHDALRALGREMLARRQIELMWRNLSTWPGIQGEPFRLLSRIAHHGEVMRIDGPSSDQLLLFRHDRVRDWLLADSATDLERQGVLPNSVIAEPYFAELIGEVLIRTEQNVSLLQRVEQLNPLALFHALRLSGASAHAQPLLQAIDRWLEDPASQGLSNGHLRWAALAMLAETDSTKVPGIVRKFRDRETNGQLARLRNGDLSGGIELCIIIGPGATAYWRDAQIEHAKLRYGANLSAALNSFLRRIDLTEFTRIGALRLAGHVGDPTLACAIEVCWDGDDDRNSHLGDYLWAFAECCRDDPAPFLGRLCDAWATISNVPDQEGWPSPRDLVAAHELRWAFQKWPPVWALDYLIQRGTQADLNGAIATLFGGIDHPKAVDFVVREGAAIQRTVGRIFTASSGRSYWRRAQEESGRPMSKDSRDLLLRLWSNEEEDRYIQSLAFSLWAATHAPDDLAVIRSIGASPELADSILGERLIRGDRTAIPAMIEKIRASENVEYWWQFGRYLWSAELTDALDETLKRRRVRASRVWTESIEEDWITHDMIMRLPKDDGERLLTAHWEHLRFSPDFVQTALYIATPRLLEAARTAITECPQPARLFVYLSSKYGIRMKGHPGLQREVQVRALSPYLDLLSVTDIATLWGACNDYGWLALRRELLDPRLQPPFLDKIWSRDRVLTALDKMIDRDPPYWIDHWIDEFLKTGIPQSEILSTIAKWSRDRRSLRAFNLLIQAVLHCGDRDSLPMLEHQEIAAVYPGNELLIDAAFAVRRRTIH
jgi:hypothetical protein